MNRPERRKVGRIQTLVGKALAVYMNDRAVNRADLLIPTLKEAFQLCVEILSKYPPEETQ